MRAGSPPRPKPSPLVGPPSVQASSPTAAKKEIKPFSIGTLLQISGPGPSTEAPVPPVGRLGQSPFQLPLSNRFQPMAVQPPEVNNARPSFVWTPFSVSIAPVGATMTTPAPTQGPSEPQVHFYLFIFYFIFIVQMRISVPLLSRVLQNDQLINKVR
jgi:hypothetical protein